MADGVAGRTSARTAGTPTRGSQRRVGTVGWGGRGGPRVDVGIGLFEWACTAAEGRAADEGSRELPLSLSLDERELFLFFVCLPATWADVWLWLCNVRVRTVENREDRAGMPGMAGDGVAWRRRLVDAPETRGTKEGETGDQGGGHGGPRRGAWCPALVPWGRCRLRASAGRA